MRPRWMRQNMACPDCGHIYRDEAELSMHCGYNKKQEPVAVDCPACKCHYTWDEFWEAIYDKWSREHVPQ